MEGEAGATDGCDLDSATAEVAKAKTIVEMESKDLKLIFAWIFRIFIEGSLRDGWRLNRITIWYSCLKIINEKEILVR